MVYSYSCPKCNQETDVIKPVADFDRQEQCDVCATVMKRAFIPQKIHLYGTAVTDAKWSPALGKIVRSDKHERQLAKERNWVEIGTENPHKHQKPRLKSYDD